MGLGLNGGGAGAVRFFSFVGAKVVATDIKDSTTLSSTLDKLKNLKNVEYVLGQHRAEDFIQADLIVKNPAIPWSNKYIKLAMEKKVPIETDASLFFQMCSLPIIGITGTKGKTTTASLIYEIFKNAGSNPLKIGVGQVSILDKILEIGKYQRVVAELSSWRLSSLGKKKISPQIAIFTNFFPDHLNYYSDLESYLKDKKNIFLNQKTSDFCVLNFDDDALKNLAQEVPGNLIWFSKNVVPLGNAVYIKDEKIYIRYKEKTEMIMPVSEVGLIGEGNLSNILSAVAGSYVAGAPAKIIRESVKNFRGVPYRLELVREISGVKYINDTAATNPGGAICSLKSLKSPIVLIAGGADKNLDFQELAEYIAQNVRMAGFLSGSATQKIIEALKVIQPKKEYEVFSSMEEAVAWAKREAKAGETVLLSPGAASFGMFQNEFERGDSFSKLVKKLEN